MNIDLSEPTKEIKIIRQSSVGASEIGVVLGLSPFMNADELWHKKMSASIGGIGFSSSSSSSTACIRGQLLEPLVDDLYKAYLLCETRRNTEAFYHDKLQLHATPDAFREGLIVEYKTSSGVRQWKSGAVSFSLQEKKVVGDGSLPASYYAQVQQQMMICGIEKAHVFALVGSTDYLNGLAQDTLSLEGEQTLLELKEWQAAESGIPCNWKTELVMIDLDQDFCKWIEESIVDFFDVSP